MRKLIPDFSNMKIYFWFQLITLDVFLQTDNKNSEEKSSYWKSFTVHERRKSRSWLIWTSFETMKA